MTTTHRPKHHAPLAAGALFTALSLLPAGAAAQGVDHDFQTWLGLFAQGPIAGRVFFQGDLHYRVYSDLSPYAALVRPGAAYLLTPGMFATVGYAWTPSWSRPGLGVGDGVEEHRAWEQWQYEFPLAGGALKLQLRTRFEQRWRPDVGSDTGLRFRQMVRVTVPLGSRWLLAVWDEVFLGLNDTDWGQRGGFDQNRVFAGVGYQFVPGVVRVEVGYANQYVSRAPNVADPSYHALMINTYVNWR